MSPVVTALLVLLLVLLLLVLLAAVVTLTPFALPLLARGAPFVPTGRQTTEVMLNLAGLRAGESFLDIGSGDGRIVIAAARRGSRAHGVELNPWLVAWARWRARVNGMGERATFSCGNLWRHDCSAYDVVSVYGLGPIMRALERKLQRELKPGARVVSHAFTFPTWQAARTQDGVYLYCVKSESRGTKILSPKS